MIKRATKIFPSLRKSRLLKHSKHVQNKEQNEMIEQEIMRHDVPEKWINTDSV